MQTFQYHAVIITSKFKPDFVMLYQKIVFIIVTTLIASNVTNIKLDLKFLDKHIYKLLLLSLALCVLEGSLFFTLSRDTSICTQGFFWGTYRDVLNIQGVYFIMYLSHLSVVT